MIHHLSLTDLAKAIGVGVGVGILTAVVMVPANLAGLPPMPEPPALAFAELVLGTDLPMPVGLLFHVLYVTFWSVVFIALFRDNPGFLKALGLGLVLWIGVLVVFFPLLGWGFLGLAVTPKMIPGSLVPHLLFAVVLWGLSRAVFGAGRARA